MLTQSSKTYILNQKGADGVWGGKRDNAGRKQPDESGIRKNHSIKYSDDEWERVVEKAKEKGLTASEYIRQKTLE